MRVDLIETKTLREQAYRRIKKLILQNGFMPGEYLSINSLATALGISHTPVREALARLQTDGLIHYESHKRLRVSDITEEDISQVYNLRKLLEPYAARLVIKAISGKLSPKEKVLKVYEKRKRSAGIQLIKYSMKITSPLT